jgi:transposase
MELQHSITDDQWDKIKDALPGKAGDLGRTAEHNRLFIDAVLWIAKTGAPCRDLSDAYGKWSTVQNRFIRWSKSGVWQMIYNTLAANVDTEWFTNDSPIIRAHQHTAGAKGAGNNRQPAYGIYA